MGNADTELLLDVGQANELKLAFRRNGYNNADIKRMCEGDTLANILPVIRGNGKVELVSHIVDCDADPFLPNDNWKVEEHIRGGQLELDMSKVEFYLSSKQQGSSYIEGNKLRKELQGLKGKVLLNANVLDYLLAHPELIPDTCKGKAVFFWGTIYRYSDGDLSVRCLYWLGGRWVWYYRWLGDDWYSSSPAAVLASN